MWNKKVLRHLDKNQLANNNLPKSSNAFAHMHEIHEKDCENKENLFFSCSIIRFHRCCDHLGVSLISLGIHDDNNNGNQWK